MIDNRDRSGSSGGASMNGAVGNSLRYDSGSLAIGRCTPWLRCSSVGGRGRVCFVGEGGTGWEDRISIGAVASVAALTGRASRSCGPCALYMGW